MKISLLLMMMAALVACQSVTPSDPAVQGEAIQSRLIQAGGGGLVLVQEVLVEAPVRKVWEAYTTEKGWRAWASPAVKMDMRTGGMIKTHYGTEAKVGDPGTNTLHVLSLVPERLLILQAEVEERWPAIMKEDAAHLMNVIVFEDLGGQRTRILSYGVGYKDSKAYRELMDFFIPANEGLFQVLKDLLEE